MENIAKFQAKYNDLCAQLGDALLKKEQLDNHIQDIKSKIQSLNMLFAALSEPIQAKEPKHE